MPDTPKIPFGYKLVDPYAPTQKGDGLWNGERFAKVKKEYPRVDEGQIVIRRCEVVQTELPAVILPEEEE